MESKRSRILGEFPYPIAYPYSLIFDERDKPSNRRWALCFTVYQLLRFVCLPLVSQYLREEIDESAAESITALNQAIAAIRSPFFSDWITLLYTLRRHLPKLGIQPLFPGLSQALDSLKGEEERPISLRSKKQLNPLDAILALRNETAHGGLPDQAQAEEHIRLYLPILHQVLDAFDFLGDTLLRVVVYDSDAIFSGRAQIRNLRGMQLSEPVEEDLPNDLAAAFRESAAVMKSAAVMIGPQGKVAPLYPLFKPVSEQESLFLYDGHYGIRVETQQGEQERSYIYYLGTHHHQTDTPACERLKELLAKRKISFFLDKEKTAPWTIADTALDYSRRTLEDLLGTKYFAECYLPFATLERHFASFLRIPDMQTWTADTVRRRYVNGFILTGLAGAGKTAFLARQVEQLLNASAEESSRENRNLVLFLRGNAIIVRLEKMSLFQDMAERLGIAVEGGAAKSRRGGGFSTFRELLDHLHQRWKQDRVEGRRLILIFDALNEAPFAEKVIREALEMAGVAACYPWCKLVFSLRQEWLSVWSGKMGAQETSPLEELRPFLFSAEQDAARRSGREAGPPVVTLEPFSETEAELVYQRYQTGAGQTESGYTIPACQTPWVELATETTSLLTNPLYLHLFMVTFNGKSAEPISRAPALFKEYVESTLKGRDGLERSIQEVIGYLVENPGRASADLSDDDAHEVRLKWGAGFSAEEIRLNLSPVEALAHEGMIRKRVREEGGGYSFVFQTVAEYLVYRYLARSRPPEEEELRYWETCAKHDKVFPEYAGAFGFLFRDWAIRGTLAQAGRLTESSARWISATLTSFLIEQARVGYVPGSGSQSAELAAKSLTQYGGLPTALALSQASYTLMTSRLRLVGGAYVKAAVDIGERLYAQNPKHVESADGLAGALLNLGILLRDAGRADEAEPAYRRSIEIYEALHGQNPEHVEIADGFALALNNLSNLLSDAGRVDEAETAYRRSVEIYEALHAQNPEHVEIANGLAMALNNLGALLRDAGRVDEAEPAYRRSVEIYEALHGQNPERVEIAVGLARALNSLGLLLSAAGRIAEAERVYRCSVEIYETLHAQNPEHVESANGLARALLNLGNLLRDAGRIAEAERVYRCSVEIREALHAQNPEHVESADGLARALTNLGLLLCAGGRAAEAEPAYRRSVEIYEALHAQNPEHGEIANGLARALNNLGLLLGNAGRAAEAEPACRRSVEIREALHEENPEHVEIGNGLALALFNLGVLLSAAGRDADAERAYRRWVEVREDLYLRNTRNIEIKAGYAATLCSVGRYTEAKQLVDEVLAIVPTYSYAKQLSRFIAERTG